MNPFDNVSAEEGVQDKRPKRTYRAQQGHNGRFIDNVLDMSDGLHAEDITPVEKALIPMPKIPKIPGAPKPPKAPTAPKTFKAPVPSTKAPNPGKPKVKESGIMKSLVPLEIAPNPQLRSKRQAAAQKAARTRMVKSERGELIARQFPIEAHQRRARQRRVRKSLMSDLQDRHSRAQLASSLYRSNPDFRSMPSKKRRQVVNTLSAGRRASVEKSGPDQADVHVPGHGSRKNRKPKYQLSMRPLERAPE